MIVIIPVHNNKEVTAQCFGAIVKSSDNKDDVKFIVIDNKSDADTAEWLIEWCGCHGRWHYRRNSWNKWFTECNFEVIADNAGEDIYLLNNDTVVFDGWLSGRGALTGWGAIGATQIHPQVKDMVIFGGGGADFAGHKAYWKWKEVPLPEIHEEDWLTGAALMINRKAYDAVGGFDLNLKHYCQDSDLSLRLKQAGYKIGVSKGMTLVHYGGVTTNAVVNTGNQQIIQQGLADQNYFAQKHGVKCGQFDFRRVKDLKAHYDVYFDNDVMQLRNKEASRVELNDLMGTFDWKGKKVLELGCAFGEIVAGLQGLGIDAHGVELSETAVKRGGVPNVKACDVLDFEDSYDVIFSKAVLEHIPQDKIFKLVKKIYKSLNSGGITHHNIDTNRGVDPTHITIYPIEWWNSVFGMNGFKVVENKDLGNGMYWATYAKIALVDGDKDYFDKSYFEDGTKNGLVNSFERYFKDGQDVFKRIKGLIPKIKPEWDILELGCAYGHTVKAFKDAGYNAQGVDISEYAIKTGNDKLNLSNKILNIETDEIKEQFDLIYSCITLEHIHEENADFVVNELAKATKPGGYNYHAIDLIQGQDTTHHCIKPRQWWIDLFKKHCFEEIPLNEEQKKLNWFLFKRTQYHMNIPFKCKKCGSDNVSFKKGNGIGSGKPDKYICDDCGAPYDYAGDDICPKCGEKMKWNWGYYVCRPCGVSFWDKQSWV
jgi:2-polyprenyl-3-methyl-5-hydroxy-6-metoxy-1,4-benzoquinol methylase/transcription elongation factor Elf1